MAEAEQEKKPEGEPLEASDVPTPPSVGTKATVAEPGTGKPELVFALVGPIGTDLHGLATSIEEKLGAFGYRCVKIKVSTLIKGMCEDDLLAAIDASDQRERTEYLMKAGDVIRNASEKGDALVPLIVAAIRAGRSELNRQRETVAGEPRARPDLDEEEAYAEDACYIVDSLKHPDEINTLRNLYGDGLILISAFDSIDARTIKLQRDIAKSNTSTELEEYRVKAEKLIETDSKRPGGGPGQNVRDAFPLGDFFIRVEDDYDAALGRFLDLFFGNPYLTPYRCEQFMAEASMAALRSADLSRQIGAVIVSPHGEVVSVGCNDVPKAGGGTYWPDEPKDMDNRDFRTGRDFNAVIKFDIVRDLLAFLEKSEIYAKGMHGPEEIARQLVTGRFRQQFKELRISNLIEFGRVVHAEMAALMRAAQRGVPVDGSTIYSTTFPCHMCARHIIASGVSRVVYIEPYPKSMTADLFPEAVLIDGKSPPSGGARHQTAEGALKVGVARPLVRFDPYEGVAPRLHGRLFRSLTDRKDARGYTVDWQRAAARPKIVGLPTFDLSTERRIATTLVRIRKVSLEACRPEFGEGEK